LVRTDEDLGCCRAPVPLMLIVDLNLVGSIVADDEDEMEFSKLF
jgi:hypothetical protein